jgi:tRNA uridine 5-carboxymethylaminomethyl modification enzyme
VSGPRKAHFAAAQAEREAIEILLAECVTPSLLLQKQVSVRDDGVSRSLADWLRFPEVDADALLRLIPQLCGARRSTVEKAVQDHRYAPYVERQRAELVRLKSDEAVRIPADLDYLAIAGLSNEMVERLSTARPSTLGAAGRIRGITPAALAAILVHARRRAA